MIDEHGLPNLDDRLLAAMRAVNPPVEKLMADRLLLRLEVRRTQQELDDAQQRIKEAQYFREVQIPRYIAIAKIAAITAASLLFIALVIALFSSLIEVKTTAPVFVSLLLPLWMVDLAEQRFGKWRFRADTGFQFIVLHPAPAPQIG